MKCRIVMSVLIIIMMISGDIWAASPSSRVIFDEGTGWTSEAGARATIARVKQGGFTVYCPCVWHGMGARWPSRTLVREPHINMQMDGLKYLIATAHAQKIAVHAWVCVNARTANIYPELVNPVAPKLWKFGPGFTSLMQTIMTEIMKYPVDGILLDYVYDSYDPPAVTDLIRAIRGVTKNKLLSVAGCAWAKPDPQRNGENLVTWANEGLIDFFWDMDYAQTPNWALYDLNRTWLKDPTKMGMIVGNYDPDPPVAPVVPRNAQMVAANLKAAMQRPSNFVGVYIYSRLSDAQVAAIKGAW